MRPGDHLIDGQPVSEVVRVNELASELTDRFSILIVDDGSTDDTYDTACDLALQFPQVSVVRLANQRGLGPAIESIRHRVTAEVVVVQCGSLNDRFPFGF